MRAKLITIGISLAMLLAPQAHALVAVSHPGSTATGYSSPVFINEQGSTMTYLNLDIDYHDVRSNDPRIAGDAPFCAIFPPGGCPLFYSDVLGQGESGDIFGTELLAEGAYGFYCSLHPWMTGTLIVQGVS